MPYLLRDRRASSSEDLCLFVRMGPVIVNSDVDLSKLSIPEAVQNKREDTLLQPPVNGEAKSEQSGDVLRGVEHPSSRPPSPPESRSETPRVTIAPCPIRLTPYVPPKNYGAVERDTIFRSGFPFWNHVDFMESLRIKSLLTLVDEDLSSELELFLNVYGVKHARVPITPNKDGRHATPDSLCEAILFAMNPTHFPLYIHCNQGKHRTGCVVACLRKIQQWPLDEVLAEYDTYASPKARPGDIELIKAFDPTVVYEYARKHDLLDSWPREKHQGHPVNIWELAAALPAHELSTMPKEDLDYDSDDGLMMTRAAYHAFCPTPTHGSLVSGPDRHNHTDGNHNATGVTVTEVMDIDDENVPIGDCYISVTDDCGEDVNSVNGPVVFAAASAQLVTLPAVRSTAR